jgi:tetratricopeptide (TPR) repeat protein
MSQLTACLIVRDEERMLSGCLVSLQGVADRIVVVDTGSRDSSVEIAKAHGAEVFHFTWCDDFAAARNFAIESVQGGFVLSIDADERLAPGAARVLKRVLKKNRLDLGLLPLHDATHLDAKLEDVLSGADRRGDPVLLPRLLRRTRDLRWEGIIHEQISGWLQSGQRRIETLDAALVHYGAVAELRKDRRKDQRNRELLERHLANSPDDVVMRSFLARELMRANERGAALEHSTRAWAQLVSLGENAARLNVIQPATLHAWLLLEAKRGDEMLGVLSTARELGGEHPNLSLLEGVACEQLALASALPAQQNEWLKRAATALARCLEAHGRPTACELLPGATHWAAATRLGTVQLLAGRPDLARGSFQRALKTKPDHLEARLGQIEALIDANVLGPAIAATEALLKHDSPDAWLLAAAAVARMGREDDLRLFASQTRQTLKRVPFLAPHRSLRWVEIERALSGAAVG